MARLGVGELGHRIEVRPGDELAALADQFNRMAAQLQESYANLKQEVEARRRELREALDRETATAEILQIISSSPTELQPVLKAVGANAARLCNASDAQIFRIDGDMLRPVASYGELWPAVPVPLNRHSVPGRAVIDREIVRVQDLVAELDEFPEGRAFARRFGHRTVLATPLLRVGVAVGAILIRRLEVHPFSDKQIELLKTFADQAAIAIENVRLFQELQARTEDLGRSVRELKVLGEVSRAVNSTLDVQQVLTTIVTHAVQLSGTDGGTIYEFDDAEQVFVPRASHGVSAELTETLRQSRLRVGDESVVGRAAASRAPQQVPDLLSVPAHPLPFVQQAGFRALLAVPLYREDRMLGALVVRRKAAGAFPPEVVELLQTFATQSALALQNARLFGEIQQQKQYWEALVQASPVAIGTTDHGVTVRSWNPAAERLFGYAAAEAIGRNLDELITTPEMREEARRYSRQTLQGERVDAITRRTRKDGTPVDVELLSVPVVVDEREAGYIAIYHDITELLRARQAAETANEAKSAFLATMSHEIRTPMNAVIGMSGLLLTTSLSEEQREYASIIRESGDALLTIINDILDFSKIEAGKMELEYQPFELRECMEATLDLVATRAAEKGLDLAYLIEAETPAAIVGDVTRLRQILLNLLSNAIKFTEKGEVVVGVTGRRLETPGGLWELAFTVRDTGIGIPADRLGRLFQPFSQLDASTARKYGGTGLGLVISKRLTELMGGKMSVESQLGLGTAFQFTVRAPAADGAVPARRDLSRIEPQLQGKRVLVVDDNETNRRILTSQMNAWGMVTRGTGSPREALDWIRAGEPFEVAILDMQMPEMDGVALGTAIRAHQEAAALPLILYTSLGRREAGAEGVAFAAYLTKPVKPSQLFDALVGVLAAQPSDVPMRGVARIQLDPELGRRHPLRILLAEDNVVNQKLALRLLGQLGYRADVAANGLETIKAVERQPYDLVLMDVQMPEMDGFEASREITRRWPGDERPRIVAMTANAMQGDRELCLAAGMDDYVSKPIRVEELVAALTQCRPSPETSPRTMSAPVGSPQSASPSAPAPAVLDPAALARLEGTIGGGFVGELIETFIEDARELLGGMQQALAESDVDAFRRAAHSLKSNAASLGATGLSERARELEALARGGTLEGAEERLGRLAAEYEAVAQALKGLGHGHAS